MSGILLDYGPAVLLWVAVVYKFPALRRNPRDPGVRAYWLTLLFLALALTVLLPPVYLALDKLAGVPNLARLVANGLGLATAWSVQAFLFHLSESHAVARRSVRRLGFALAGVLVLMAGLFVAAPVDQEALDFSHRFADAPYILEYRLAFLLYLGIASGNVARLSWRFATLANRPSLRLGLRIVALGGIVGLVYVTHEGLYVVTRRLNDGYPVPDPVLVTHVLVAVGVGLTVIGSTMPAWGPRLGISRLCREVGLYRSMRRLYPLWLDLYRVSPEIALQPPPSRLTDTLTVRDLDFRLYRRVVEIRDGRLALRPYLEPRIADAADSRCQEGGLAGEEAHATIEAACLAAAVQAKASGRVPAGGGHASAPPGGNDMTGEIASLERVARCYASSPIVQEVVSQLEQVDATTTDSDSRIAGGSQ